MCIRSRWGNTPMFAICTYILYSYQNVDAHLVGTGFIWEGRCQKNLERFVNVDRTLNLFSYNRTLQVWSKETVTFKWSFRFVHIQYWEVWRFAKFSIYSNILIFTGHNKQFDKIWHFQGECASKNVQQVIIIKNVLNELQKRWL